MDMPFCFIPAITASRTISVLSSQDLFVITKTAAVEFALWLNASGRKADKVELQLRSAKVPVARTTTVALDQLPALLVSADAHLVTLRSPFSGIVLPSKVYGCIASGRPIVYVGPKSSDIHLLCCEEQSRNYAQIEPGDVTGFAAALERLADQSQRRGPHIFRVEPHVATQTTLSGLPL